MASAQYGNRAAWYEGNGGYSTPVTTLGGALAAQGCDDLVHVSSFPQTFVDYKVVFLAANATPFSNDQMASIKAFVEDGGFLIMLGDSTTWTAPALDVFNDLLGFLGMTSSFTYGDYDPWCGNQAVVYSGASLAYGVTDLYYADSTGLSMGLNTSTLGIGQSSQTILGVEGRVLLSADLNIFDDACTEVLYNTPLFYNLWNHWEDLDGDGWSIDQGDCYDGDPAIYPGAPEICNDGTDQNCDGVLDETTDNDGDGYSTCFDDCDDTDATRFPGAAEICDHFDSDCDGDVDEDFDLDSDGYVDSNEADCQVAYSASALDCDDGSSSVYPGATETCNGYDDNCDGTVDEQYDVDSDGFTICTGDCNDFNPDSYPNALEFCDGEDNNCDGYVSPNETIDEDGDGYLGCLECDDTDAAIHPGASELCDGIDNNCDNQIDEPYDLDGDGYTTCNDDCNDYIDHTYPGAPELCDGLDNDCDGSPASDEFDLDGDGFIECEECDDTNPTTYPGAVEICDDGIDSDCGADLADTEVDNDGDGWSECGGDCDDGSVGVNPGATDEPYNGIDEDCDGGDLDDLDSDGFRGGIFGNDCDDTDAHIHPEADEDCYDGLDNDCDYRTDEDDEDCPASNDDVGSTDPEGCGACSYNGPGAMPGAMIVLLSLATLQLRRRI